MDILPVCVLVLCALRRYADDGDKTVAGLNVIAALFAGLGTSLISVTVGIGVILILVCVLDVFHMHIRAEKNIVVEAMLVLPFVLCAVAGVYFAAKSTNNSSYVWPAIGMFLGALFRAMSAFKAIFLSVDVPE